jgi:hypothetical protein
MAFFTCHLHTGCSLCHTQWLRKVHFDQPVKCFDELDGTVRTALLAARAPAFRYDVGLTGEENRKYRPVD